MMGAKYTSPPMTLSGSLRQGRFKRADIVFHDVDHSGPTFEARVFLNNADADENTPTDAAHGYAGSFYVFGHGQCFGDLGHCDVNRPVRSHDKRTQHPLTANKGIVVATDAIRAEAGKGQPISVTVVPVIMAADDDTDLDHVLKFGDVRVVAYG
jgi:tyrosinase